MDFSIDELMQIEEVLHPKLQDDLVQILARLNRDNKLEEFCRMIGAEDVLKQEKTSQPSKSGIIIVVGESQVKEHQMQGILKNLGIRKERLECHLGYEKAKTFNYRKLQYQAKYSLVIVGSMGHKAENIGDYSSAITMMEQEKGYPHVIRLGTNELKITKSNLKEALSKALADELIKSD